MATVPAFPRGGIEKEIVGTTKKRGGDTLNDGDAIFGAKRTRRIEVVQTKGDNKKNKGNNKASGTPDSHLPVALTGVGLGMTKSMANNKVLFCTFY